MRVSVSFILLPRPPLFVCLSVLQVFPVHDQVQLRSPAHLSSPNTAQQQACVASRSPSANRGTKHSACHVQLQRPAGTAACSGINGSICNIEVKGHFSAVINDKRHYSTFFRDIFKQKARCCRNYFCSPILEMSLCLTCFVDESIGPSSSM